MMGLQKQRTKNMNRAINFFLDVVLTTALVVIVGWVFILLSVAFGSFVLWRLPTIDTDVVYSITRLLFGIGVFCGLSFRH